MCLRVVALMALAVGAATEARASGVEGETSCPIVASTDFAIYGQVSEGGVAASSRRWMAHFFDWWQAQDPAVDYVFLSAAEARPARPQVDLPEPEHVGPAGRQRLRPAGRTWRDRQGEHQRLHRQRRSLSRRLRRCVLRRSDYWWEGEHYAHPHLLGAYPRTMEGAISRIAPWPSYAMTTLSNGRNAIYYGGPTIGLQHTNLSNLVGEKEASFASVDGGLPAVIVYGNLLLTSVHLEAFEDDESNGLGAADRIENYRYLATLINRVARTNFKIPGTAP